MLNNEPVYYGTGSLYGKASGRSAPGGIVFCFFQVTIVEKVAYSQLIVRIIIGSVIKINIDPVGAGSIIKAEGGPVAESALRS